MFTSLTVGQIPHQSYKGKSLERCEQSAPIPPITCEQNFMRICRQASLTTMQKTYNHFDCERAEFF
jgi:hypothetical protein